MIIPDYTFLIQWANFIVLLVLLNFLLFRPILRRMESREKAISDNLDAAAADRAEAEWRMAEYAEALSAARRQGMEALQELERQVSGENRRAIEEKRSEAERMTEEARAQIERRSREAEQALETQVRDLASAIGRRVAGREIRV
ncbi:MAG: hypothetical protein ACE5IM_11095 [Nitrospinota bacterium]